METVELAGNLRTKTGKGAARQLRRDGLVPGTVYGGKDNLLVSLNQKELSMLFQMSKANAIINLKVENSKERKVVFKEIQKKVIDRDVLHVDLYEISMEKKLKMAIPIEETGTAIGIKMGGILTHLFREIKVETLPTNIPKSIKIDVSNLDVGQSLHIRDIQAPEGVAILDNPDDTICVIKLAEAEKSKEAEAADADATGEAEATATPEGDKDKPEEDKEKKEK